MMTEFHEFAMRLTFEDFSEKPSHPSRSRGDASDTSVCVFGKSPIGHSYGV